jgi:hypothetical protein
MTIDQNDTEPGTLRDRFPAAIPSTVLEQRVMHSLRARRWLSPVWYRRRLLRWAVPVAACAASLLVGMRIGRAHDAIAGSASAPRYALLLFDVPGEAHSDTNVAAYRAWAADLKRTGHTITGDALAPGGETLVRSAAAVADSAGAGELAGFFIVSAASRADAIAIAESSPHYRRGGRIVVRRVERT